MEKSKIGVINYRPEFPSNSTTLPTPNIPDGQWGNTFDRVDCENYTTIARLVANTLGEECDWSLNNEAVLEELFEKIKAKYDGMAIMPDPVLNTTRVNEDSQPADEKSLTLMGAKLMHKAIGSRIWLFQQLHSRLPDMPLLIVDNQRANSSYDKEGERWWEWFTFVQDDIAASNGQIQQIDPYSKNPYPTVGATDWMKKNGLL